MSKSSDLLALFEMANITKRKYGVPVNFWASPKPENDKGKLRIKVAYHKDNIANPNEKGAFILFDLKSGQMANMQYQTKKDTKLFRFEEISIKDLKDIVRLVEDNFDLFKKFWNLEIDEDQFKEDLYKATR